MNASEYSQDDLLDVFKKEETRIALTRDLLSTLENEDATPDPDYVWTQAEAREALKYLAYLLAYKMRNTRGNPADELEAHSIICLEYMWLVEVAGYRHYGPKTVISHAEKWYEQDFINNHDSRSHLAAVRLKERIKEVDLMMPVLVARIMKGDLGQVTNYVALANMDGRNVGYQSPGQINVTFGTGDNVITEAEKLKAALLAKETKEYERLLKEDKLLEAGLADGGIVEVDFEQIAATAPKYVPAGSELPENAEISGEKKTGKSLEGL